MIRPIKMSKKDFKKLTGQPKYTPSMDLVRIKKYSTNPDERRLEKRMERLEKQCGALNNWFVCVVGKLKKNKVI